MVPDWLAAATASGGETAAPARSYDWSTSPLGPAEDWPHGLRSAVALCFGTRFAVLVTWGPELTMIYNDGYRQMLGTDKHPAAWAGPMRSVWAEVWDGIAPYVDKAR